MNDFYKKIHPEQFSDSKMVKKSNLSREILNYLLETLTSESKEKDFEEYCKRIVEATITPNLLPQTGPTGGGDSKVDSETYPVSEKISEGWLYGFGDRANKERWAFAISAKKDWRGKIRSDVKKIFAVNEVNNREYTKIFFLTNQFVPDKKRADVEDSLKKEFEIDIRILDKNWLLDNTFKNNNEVIAIEALKLQGFYENEEYLGDRDKIRKEKLNEIENQLRNVEDLRAPEKVELSSETVVLYRELEMDELKMKGVLERNVRIAKEYGMFRDYINSIYDYAWTVLWWYDDLISFYDQYEKLEELFVNNRENYYLLKKLSILWITLYANNNSEKYIVKKIDTHTKLITESFESIIHEENAGRRGLLAEYDYQVVRLSIDKDFSKAIENFIRILNNDQSDLEVNLEELGKYLEIPLFKECENYDELFELYLKKIGERNMNIASARLLISRGDDYSENKYYKAISYYSRAMTKIIYEESEDLFIELLMKLGISFQAIGLNWSARSFYLRAFTKASRRYFDKGEYHQALFLSLRFLKRLELYLFRIDYSIRFNEIEQMLLSGSPYEIKKERELDLLREYDSRLAIFFLNLPSEKIDSYCQIPDYLEKTGLEISSVALKYRLGYYDEDYLDVLGSTEEIDDIMEKLFNQPFSQHISDNLVSPDSGIYLNTIIIGCEVSVQSATKNIILEEFCSSILSTLENISSSLLIEKLIPYISEFEIEVRDIEGKDFRIWTDIENGKAIVSISNINEMTNSKFRDTISENIVLIMSVFLSEILFQKSSFDFFKYQAEEENTVFRTLTVSNTLDTFGAYEKPIQEYEDVINGKKFPLVDNNIFKLKHNQKNNQKENPKKETEPKIDFDNSDKEMRGKFGNLRHDDIIMDKTIDVNLWDRAKWFAVQVMFSPELGLVLGLVFENSEGNDIFKKWKDTGKYKDISVGIITEIDEDNPYWYRVIIGKRGLLEKDTKKIYAHKNRVHTMNANNDKNIQILKRISPKINEFSLIPVMEKDMGKMDGNINLDNRLTLPVEALVIKRAVDIRDNDFFLMTGVMGTDKPIINTDEKMPIESFIEWKKKKEAE